MSNQQGTLKMLRRVGAGVAAFGVLAGIPQAASAAEKVEDQRMSFTYVLPSEDNPCTPQFDDIAITVSGDVVLKTWLNNDGSSRRQIFVRTHLSGEAADGTNYVGGDSFHAQTRTEDGFAYIDADTQQRLTSAGDAGNFHLRYKVRVAFDLSGTNSTMDVVKDSTECRG